jgi:hypothetical protein
MKVKHRYFLSIAPGVPEKEVTKEQFVDAERGSGFHGKIPGEPATGGFHAANGMRGRIKTEIEE